MGGFSAARQRLREWLCDGADRSTPSPNQIDVRARFAPLMRWVLSLWESDDLALAIDPTTLSDRLCAIVASVVYRGCAIPVAWVVLPGNKPGKWIDPAVDLLAPLSVAIPTNMRVIVMTDRGLRSPKLWKKIRSLDWHPYMRQSISTIFCIENGMRMPARRLVSTPNGYFIGRGTAFRAASRRLRGTIIVIWVGGKPVGGTPRGWSATGWHWRRRRAADARRGQPGGGR